MFLRIFSIICVSLLGSSPALAWIDCNTDAFKRAFDDRLSPTQPCHSYELSNIQIGSVSTPVRLVRYDRAFDETDSTWLEHLELNLLWVSTQATDMAAGLRVQPISIVMTDLEERVDTADHDAPAHTGPDIVHGVTYWGRLPGECPIATFKLQEAVSMREFDTTIAHEIFHCIQIATWPAPAQTGNSWWWVEGSAEYFGIATAGRAPDGAGQAEEFGELSQIEGLSETGTSNPLDYENVAFFSWLDQNGGPAAVGAFLGGMTEGDQLATLQSLLPLSQWAEFTEDLIEGGVALPTEVTVPTGQPMDRITINADEGTEPLLTDAYRTYRAALVAGSPARYEVSIETDDTAKARFRQGESEWQDFPATLDGCRNAASAVAYAITTQGPKELSLSYRKVADCSPCETAGALDSCMAGRWLMTGGGPIEWMRANGMPAMAHVEASEMVVQMTRDGQYLMQPVTVTAEANNDGMAITGDGQSVGLSGNWGTADGVLHVCPMSGEITANVQTEGGSVYRGLFGPGGNMEMAYTCRGNTMTTTIDIPGLPPMETSYTRQ